MSLSGFTKALAVVGFSAFSSIASADFIQTFPGNDCSGVFGQGFANCKIPADIDLNESPIIIKFDVGAGGGLTFEINPLFQTIDGSEFAFTGTNTPSGTWTYTPGAGDPVINFFVAKGGSGFNVFSNLGDPNSDDWYTPDNRGGQNPNLSHLSFYDTDGGGQVPEPTTLLLLGAGLFAAGFARRRVKHN